MRIHVTEDGPYRVTGGVPLSRQIIMTDAEGQSVSWEEGERFGVRDEYLLCRCGDSARKPFCDGTHERIGFRGAENASREPYLAQADELDGPELALTDAGQLCSFARFCDAGDQIWNLVEQPGHAAEVRREAGLCPSGRLVAWDLTARAAQEPGLEPSIGVVEDPGQGVSGPLWVRGGIPVTAADGGQYEVRNRATLCRCGASGNKPFCDGSHAAIGFRDDDESAGRPEPARAFR